MSTLLEAKKAYDTEIKAIATAKNALFLAGKNRKTIQAWEAARELVAATSYDIATMTKRAELAEREDTAAQYHKQIASCKLLLEGANAKLPELNASLGLTA